jgi:hypothetical protein
VTGAVRIAFVLALAAAATIVANVILLGVANGPHDPVGRLTPPAAQAVALHAPPAQPPPQQQHRTHESEHADD